MERGAAHTRLLKCHPRRTAHRGHDSEDRPQPVRRDGPELGSLLLNASRTPGARALAGRQSEIPSWAFLSVAGGPIDQGILKRTWCRISAALRPPAYAR